MNRIWIARHLLCEMDISVRLSAEGFAAWSRDYDDAPIRGEIPPELTEVAAGAIVVTSPYTRARQTAVAAGCADPIIEPALSRIARPAMPIPLLRARPLTWRGLGRAAWLAGWTYRTETRRQAAARARAAAHHLLELAERKDVLAIGHGYQNQQIAAVLLRRGYRGPRWPAKKPGVPTCFRPPA